MRPVQFSQNLGEHPILERRSTVLLLLLLLLLLCHAQATPRPFPVSDCSPASFVHWMGKPKASETGAICRNTMEIISPGGLPPPLFLPPANSLQTRIRVFMGFLAICLTPGSIFILIPHEDIFSGLLRQNPEPFFFGIFQLVFLQTGGNEIFCQFDLST